MSHQFSRPWSATCALVLTICTSLSGADPQLVRTVALDRWIDVAWEHAGEAPTHFTIEVGDGDLRIREQVPGSDHRASVYLTSDTVRALSGRAVRVQVLACDQAGKIIGRSAEQRTRLAAPVDLEERLRTRFGDHEKHTGYNAADPAYLIIYDQAQRQAQRERGRALAADLAKLGPTFAAREFTIQPQVYRVDPGQLKITKAANLVIRATGVEIIIDGERSGEAFVFDTCSGIRLTGRSPAEDGTNAVAHQPLTIDSEQLPMSVARILACDPDQRTLDVEILPGYSIDIPASERMLAYDQHGHLVNRRQMGWQSLTSLGERRFRLTVQALRDQDDRKTVLIPGHLLALHNDPQHRLHTHGVVSSRGSRDMVYESIVAVHGGGSPADHGTKGATVFRDWRLIPRPGTSRLPITTGLGQFSKDGGSFLFEDCSFGPHLDDGINLLSSMSMVGAATYGAEALIVGGVSPTVGSTLTFHDYVTWAPLGTATVSACERIDDPATLAAANAFARKNRTRENARNAYRTKLDQAITVPDFAMVIHSDRRADEIVVRGCLFRDQLAQIMLLQGAKSGLIENNLLLRSTGGGISAQFSQYWWEGPMPGHLLIRNNVIRDNPIDAAVNGFAGNGSIAVYAGTQMATDQRLMHDFRIEGNTIINPSAYGIVVRNTDQVSIRGNRIVNPWAKPLQGTFRGRSYDLLRAAICLDAVSQARIDDNDIIFGNERCQRSLLIEPNCDSASINVGENRESVSPLTAEHPRAGP
jgi:hypothetical protein